MADKTGTRPRLCLGCNYPLDHLTVNRCPECGRDFDPTDPSTFNCRRPLTWFDHQLIAPIGWPTWLVLAGMCGSVLWIASHPGVYWGYPFLTEIILGVWLWGPAAAYLGIRELLAWLILPRGIDRQPRGKRISAVFLVLVLTSVLVLTATPVRVWFWMVKPGLARWVQDIQALGMPPHGTTRRIGGWVFELSFYSDGQVLFFTVDGGGGFAYKPDDGTPLRYHYNYGGDGRLGGPWYWWVDD